MNEGLDLLKYYTSKFLPDFSENAPKHTIFRKRKRIGLRFLFYFRET